MNTCQLLEWAGEYWQEWYCDVPSSLWYRVKRERWVTVSPVLGRALAYGPDEDGWLAVHTLPAPLVEIRQILEVELITPKRDFGGPPQRIEVR
jgi:hypothetical protein